MAQPGIGKILLINFEIFSLVYQNGSIIFFGRKIISHIIIYSFFKRIKFFGVAGVLNFLHFCTGVILIGISYIFRHVYIFYAGIPIKPGKGGFYQIIESSC